MVCAQRDYRRVTPIPNSSSSEADITPPIQAPKIRDYTTKEKLKVIAGAVTALVIVGWLVVFASALMSANEGGLIVCSTAGTARLGPKPSLPVCGSTALDYAVVSDLFGHFIVANRCKRQ
jgi:hypothetical protein